jgi:hypothetical protein
MPKKYKSSFKEGIFFLKIGKYVCQKIQNFMLISYLKEYFGKKSALEKLDPANRFLRIWACSQRKKSGVQQVPSDPLSVQLCWMWNTKEAGVQYICAQPGPVWNHTE